MITDPRFAPRRGDVPYLQRRRRPAAAQTAAGQGGAGQGAVGQGAAAPQRSAAEAKSAVADFVAGRASRPGRRAAQVQVQVRLRTDFLTHRRRPAPEPTASAPAQPTPATLAPAAQPSSPPAPSSSGSLDLDEPVSSQASGGASLDLDGPATPPTPPSPSPPSTSGSLDLDASATSGSSLDLGGSTAPPAAAPDPEPPRRQRTDERVRPGSRTLLTVGRPTVTLTRMQSGIGSLAFEAACSDEVGDLRIGCAYQLYSGRSSTVQLSGGNRLAPPRSRRPIIVASHDRFEELALDLRQCRDLRRLIVYAFSETRQELKWGGILIMTTFAGARIELPLESLRAGDVAVLMSLYNVHGEFVLRAEMQTLYGGPREASRAYGFERISWIDDRTIVD